MKELTKETKLEIIKGLKESANPKFNNIISVYKLAEILAKAVYNKNYHMSKDKLYRKGKLRYEIECTPEEKQNLQELFEHLIECKCLSATEKGTVKIEDTILKY